VKNHRHEAGGVEELISNIQRKTPARGVRIPLVGSDSMHQDNRSGSGFSLEEPTVNEAALLARELNCSK